MKSWFPLLVVWLLFTIPASPVLADGVLTERTYKRLTVIHQMIGDGKYGEALERLEDLSKLVKRRPYEYATVLQTYGFVYAASDRYKEAIRAFEEAMSLDKLPEGVQLRMQYNVAQLYAAIEEYRKAAEVYEAWLAKAESPSESAHVFAATIYAQLKSYDKAIFNIRKAIEMSEKPQESWYQLLLAMLYESKQYKASAELLEKMIALFPDKKQYWSQLAGVYFTLKQDRKSLAVTELANKRGFLTEEKELENLVDLYLYLRIPYKAAALLEEEIATGRIPRDKKRLEKLGEAWIMAKENDRAMRALLEAAALENDGILYMRTAQLLAEKERWSEVLSAVQKAIAAGGLKKPGEAYLFEGMAYYEKKQYEKARSSFEKSRKYNDSREQALNWITYIDTETSLQ